MKKIAFIGGYDKADMLLYICKIVNNMKKKVLYVDTTLIEKTKYIVPTMTPTSKYVTTYDGIDIAIGFDNIQELKEYMGAVNELDYDYLICDLDSADKYLSFGFYPKDKHFFVTSFDVYSVQRGIDVLKAIKDETPITRVLFTKDTHSEEIEYLDFATFNLKVKWNKEIVFFPFETEDLYAIFLNQRFSKVKFAGLSTEYVDCLSYVTELMTENSSGEIRKAVKMIDRA